MKVPIERTDEVASDQVARYTSATQAASPILSPLIHRLHSIVLNLQPQPVYALYIEVRFIWEFLDMADQTPAIREVVDAWLADESNVQRLSTISGRTARTGNILAAFGVFRRKARSEEEWAYLNDHTKPVAKDHPDHGLPQTVVFIAISELNASNGSFITLRPGDDLIIDSSAEIAYPPTGGGLGIAMWMRI